MFHYKIDEVVLAHTSPISSKEFNKMVFEIMTDMDEGCLNPEKVAERLTWTKGFTLLNTMAEVDLYKMYEDNEEWFKED